MLPLTEDTNTTLSQNTSLETTATPLTTEGTLLTTRGDDNNGSVNATEETLKTHPGYRYELF